MLSIDEYARAREQLDAEAARWGGWTHEMTANLSEGWRTWTTLYLEVAPSLAAQCAAALAPLVVALGMTGSMHESDGKLAAHVTITRAATEEEVARQQARDARGRPAGAALAPLVVALGMTGSMHESDGKLAAHVTITRAATEEEVARQQARDARGRPAGTEAT